MYIRQIKASDYQEIRQLLIEAFTQSEHGYGNEAELVEKIRLTENYITELELVAVVEDKVVGHGLMSKVHIVDGDERYEGLVLAPLATLPISQGTGVGTALMHELERIAVQMNFPFVSILGHPSYYGKFGYVPASRYQIKAPFEVPDEAFMIRPLREGGLDGVEGRIQYSKAFG